jgi:hypothetical protein
MAHKDIFWMACDSTEDLRAEYGPFHTREDAEAEARKLGFHFLLRYEHLVGDNEEIEDVRCVFVEMQDESTASTALAIPDAPALQRQGITFHTRCASCGETETHERAWQAEVWADIHEFEHSRHKVRLFEHSRSEGMREISDWRGSAA